MLVDSVEKIAALIVDNCRLWQGQALMQVSLHEPALRHQRPPYVDFQRNYTLFLDLTLPVQDLIPWFVTPAET